MNSESLKLDKYLYIDGDDDDDLMSLLLRIGLYIGALFQLVCIASSIMLPSEDACVDCSPAEVSPRPGGEVGLNAVRRLRSLRKQDKKKRR